MNFKKLLVNKCQKQFFQMLNQERQDRKMRSRKNSSNLVSPREPGGGDIATNSDNMMNTNVTDEEKEDEFSKPMMYLYDLEELNQRRKE